MIQKLRVNNFKAFIDADFQFSALNLFTGLNGMGKSTVHQILLLLRQSYLGRTTSTEHVLVLNGELVRLGKWKDIYARYATNQSIEIHCNTDKGEGHWINKEGLEDVGDGVKEEFNKRGLGDINDEIEGDFNSDGDFWNSTLFQKGSFIYLSADRVSPQTSYPTGKQKSVLIERELGNRGEFTFQYLNKYGDEGVLITPHEAAHSDSLRDNVIAWLGEISPNVKIQTKSFDDIDLLQLSFSFSGTEGTGSTGEFRPQNVGFGLTYILPIIVAVLSAKPNDILIIENPEAHLHPKGQSKMGYLLSLAAQKGVQLFVETHSDHVLNGIRVATKKKDIDFDKIKVFYFDRSDSESKLNHSTKIHNITIDSDGRLDKWPQGFFDEWDNMLDELLND